MALKQLRIGMVVGEASGDQLAAPVVQALKKHFPDVEIFGIAGPKMMQEGCRSLYDMERLSIMGFDLQVIARIWELYKVRRNLIKAFLQQGLDLFIGVDAPAFNIGLEEKLKSKGINTIHYISPSVWAWRSKRIHKIKRAVDLMLVMLPFESKIYHQHNIPVKYIGHPLADEFAFDPDSSIARKKLGLSEPASYIALLPGSRDTEIRLICEDMLEAASILQAKSESIKFLMPLMSEAQIKQVESIKNSRFAHLNLQLFHKQSHEVMAASDFIVLTSGTATLEALLLKKPMVVVYRFSKTSYWIAKRLVKLPYYSLPNLLAGKKIVEELIQDELTGANLAQSVLQLWENEEKQAQLKEQFYQVHHELKKSATEQFVQSVLNTVQGMERQNA